MGLLTKFFKTGSAGGAWEVVKSVAVVSDSYFLFEENGLPLNQLKRNEVSMLAKETIISMVPAGAHETASGFFVDGEKSSMVTFVASRERLFSEISQLTSCKYWVPERFFRERVSNEYKFPSEQKCLILEIESGGFCSVNGKKVKLFVEDFWNVEMHGDSEKSINKKIEFIDGFYGRAIFPVLSVTAGLLLLFIGLVVANFTASALERAIVAKQSEVDHIIERSKLRDEISTFSASKLSYFRRLKTMADLRPSELIFNAFSSKGGIVDVVGECDSVATLNGFIVNLKKASGVTEVSESNVTSSQDSVSFNLKVKFL
ncbi:MAG: hypothetical protein LBR91_00450 [Puniceicoccales bacterium]|nr:hypothetical protein [Puniceicoccales bacterium]